ncbi:MAG: ribonuclease P protein component [Candidatus Sulfotelmatobacter sp.]
MAELLFCEERVTHAQCGADTPIPEFASTLFVIRRIETCPVTAFVPEGNEDQRAAQLAGKVRFPRSGRLLRHADFERVYKQGRRHFSTAMTVFYLRRQPAPESKTPTNAVSGPRVGFTVGRALGGAVHRNRMKRRLREAVRLTRGATGPDVDVVINPKKSILTADFEVVVNEVRRAFAVIEQKMGTESTAEKVEKPETGNRKPN